MSGPRRVGRAAYHQGQSSTHARLGGLTHSDPSGRWLAKPQRHNLHRPQPPGTEGHTWRESPWPPLPRQEPLPQLTGGGRWQSQDAWGRGSTCKAMAHPLPAHSAPTLPCAPSTRPGSQQGTCQGTAMRAAHPTAIRQCLRGSLPTEETAVPPLLAQPGWGGTAHGHPRTCTCSHRSGQHPPGLGPGVLGCPRLPCPSPATEAPLPLGCACRAPDAGPKGNQAAGQEAKHPAGEPTACLGPCSLPPLACGLTWARRRGGAQPRPCAKDMQAAPCTATQALTGPSAGSVPPAQSAPLPADRMFRHTDAAAAEGLGGRTPLALLHGWGVSQALSGGSGYPQTTGGRRAPQAPESPAPGGEQATRGEGGFPAQDGDGSRG